MENNAISIRLGGEFYNMRATYAAPALLGKLLCVRHNDRVDKLRITETECYFGENDTACHAHRGKTERTKILYEEGGLAYVYLCYGIHCLLNIVTGEKDFPQAVLIRGVEGYSGPGKLTKASGIDRSYNYENLLTSERLWIEDDGQGVRYKKTPRIGIDYATEKYRKILWRFIVY